MKFIFASFKNRKNSNICYISRQCTYDVFNAVVSCVRNIVKITQKKGVKLDIMVEFPADVYKVIRVRSASIVLCSTYDARYQEINKIHEICTPLYSALIAL